LEPGNRLAFSDVGSPDLTNRAHYRLAFSDVGSPDLTECARLVTLRPVPAGSIVTLGGPPGMTAGTTMS
jgi:hypothetical protein